MAKRLVQGSAKPVWIVRADGAVVESATPLPVELATVPSVEPLGWVQPVEYHHGPAADTAAVVTLTGVAGWQWQIAGVYWSYSEAPTGGSLVFDDAGLTKLGVDIPDAGVGFLPFAPPMKFAEGATVTITLAAGAGTCLGKLTIEAKLG